MRLTKPAVASYLKHHLSKNKFWMQHLRQKTFPNVHLAIFRDPYLQFIVEGRKTIETRFSRVACAPYHKVASGDIVLLKKAGRPVSNICVVKKTWFYVLQPGSLKFIREKFGESICPAGDSFWEDRKRAVYATLMLIDRVTPLQSLTVDKRDRRGWVVVKDGTK
jgi:ASC-1-like (ASCH) protein